MVTFAELPLVDVTEYCTLSSGPHSPNLDPRQSIRIPHLSQAQTIEHQELNENLQAASPRQGILAADQTRSSAPNGNPGRSGPCVHQRSSSTHLFGSAIQAMRDAARPGASWHAGQAVAISRAVAGKEGDTKQRRLWLGCWLTGRRGLAAVVSHGDRDRARL